MNRALAILSCLIVLAIAGHYLWGNKFQPISTDSPSLSIAILPFQLSGSAASGQYALELDNFTDAIANRLGTASDWTVVESSRKDMLIQEIEESMTESAAVFPEYPIEITDNTENVNSSLKKEAEEIAIYYDAADYVVLGKINGFDVSPERSSDTAKLSKRVNRIKTVVDIRIVDVQTREWFASQTVHINEQLPDENSAETQIQQAIQLAAQKVVNALLLSQAKEFEVLDVRNDTEGLWVGVSGGSQQGVEVGMIFNVVGENAAKISAKIEIIEVRASTSVAKVLDGDPMLQERIPAKPALDQKLLATAPQIIRVAIGGVMVDGISKNTRAIVPAIVNKLKNQLQVSLEQFGGVNIYEDSQGIVNKVLSKQMLDDLTKGREPALPRGTLKSVDYLVFYTIDHLDLIPKQQTTYKAFGTTITDTKQAQGKMDSTIYLIDVNSGEYVFGRKVSTDVALAGDNIDRYLSQAGESFAREMAAEVMLAIRPLMVIATSDDELILNHKDIAGLKVGDQFSATGKGQSIYDEHTQTNLENIGGIQYGDIEIASFDSAGWARAKIIKGDTPPAGALLKKLQTTVKNGTKSIRKLNW